MSNTVRSTNPAFTTPSSNIGVHPWPPETAVHVSLLPAPKTPLRASLKTFFLSAEGRAIQRV